MKSKAAILSDVSAFEQFQRDYVRPKEGRTLIVGSQVYGEKEDRRARYSDVVGVDMLPGPGVDRVLDLEDDLPDDLGLFDHVECMSVLEHSKRPWLLAANIERLMKPRSTLFVTVPWIWRYHAYDHDYFRFSCDGIRAIFPLINWGSLMFASDTLCDGTKVKTIKQDDYPYFIRTETYGFGVRQ